MIASFGPQDEAEVNIMALLRSNRPDAEKKGALVEEILHRVSIKTMDDTGEMLYCELGRYVEGAEAKVLELLESLGDYLITNKMRSEVMASIKAKTFTARVAFDKDRNTLNLTNGLLNLETGEFQEGWANYLSISQLPVKYDPKATCPSFAKFLREILIPEHIAVVVKLLGYLLYRNSIYQKAFMFCGEGSNGKSTLINAIEAFIGKENRSSVSLQDITNNRFAKAELYGKLANLFSDIPAEKILNTGEFKMLVSGDPIGAERKHQQRFTFENYAKLIFSANQIPKTGDNGYAYIRRWVIIPFNRVFEGEDADEHLLEKLTTEQELSGILNLALKGLAKLKAERGFKEIDPEEIRKQYELGASRIKTFVQEKCTVEAGNEKVFVESARLHEAYRSYCRQHGTSYFDERRFGEELKAVGIIHKQKMVYKKRIYYDFGIILKDGLLDYLDKSTTILFPSTSTIEKEIVSDSPKELRGP